MTHRPWAIVVMGVTSTGKTSVGQALARRLGARFVDGDDLHPAANRAKMAAGTPLGDADRAPWLARVGRVVGAGGSGRVVACSALRRTYRTAILRAAGRPVTFAFLDGDRALIAARMAAREGHFMPTSLLDSQFATLERPGPAERAVRVPIDRPPEAVAVAALRALGLLS